MTFQNLRSGQRVKYRRYNGLKLVRDGERAFTVPEYRIATGTVQRFLCFDTHVVVSAGRGRAQVVDRSNFLEVVS